MSRSEETIIKSESGIALKQKASKKYTFNPPAGNLILTDSRFIFARSGGEFAKRLVAGALLGGIVGSEAMRGMTKVKAEELDKALDRPDSFQVNLQDISEVKTEKQLATALLSIQWNGPEKPKALFYRTGIVSSIGGFDEWVKAVNAARQRQTTQSPSVPPQPVPYGAPAPSTFASTPPVPPQMGTSYRPSVTPPVGPETVFCMYCGARIPETASFCGSCGKKQE